MDYKRLFQTLSYRVYDTYDEQFYVQFYSYNRQIAFMIIDIGHNYFRLRYDNTGDNFVITYRNKFVRLENSVFQIPDKSFINYIISLYHKIYKKCCAL